MSGTYSNLNFHVVFSTKGCRRLIIHDLEQALHKYISAIVKQKGGQVLRMGGTEDHVHMVMRLKPAMPIPDLMRQIKAQSSKWFNDRHNLPEPFSWQVGYGIFSVSQSQLNEVIRYVDQQKTHHREMSFKQEFAAMLKRQGVAFDPKYLW
ncbi:MAG: IS200/IS605 family transposase [Acidobacteria bacterium]|nr:IS200/IS605 family transposase [Acidobacteriota bacterium]